MATSASLTLSETDFELLGQCIDTIGTPEFAQTLCEFGAGICHADSIFLSAFFENEKPVALFSNHSDEPIRDALTLYTDVAYVLDPFYLHFRQNHRDEVLRLTDIAPDGFRKSEYHRQFYEPMGLNDECGLMVHIAHGAALFFSFGAREAGQRTRPARLDIAKPLLFSLARRHWTKLSPEHTDGSGRLAAHLEQAFEKFGSSVLSPREGEIVRMILRGHSSKSIARAFDNSPETIKVHRRRIYTKLRVESQGQLLSLFLSCLSATPAGHGGDPLQQSDVS